MPTANRAFTRSRLARTGAAAAIILASMVFVTTSSNAVDKTIRTMGTEDVHINSKIFSPAAIACWNSV